MEGLAAWVDRGRTLVLTFDRPPAELPRVAAGVQRPLAGGVVAGIETPEPALRLAILERKASDRGLILDPQLAVRLAHAIGGNVRRLEGALTRLLAHGRLRGRAVDEEFATEVLPELRTRPLLAFGVERIVTETAAVFGRPARALLGRSRRRELALPRQVAMYLARHLLGRPLTELAGIFGRDHTTVLYAWRTVTSRLGADRALGALVQEIERRLTTGTP